MSPESFPDLLEEKQLDLTDIQARIPDDREIAITPEVRKPENIAPGGAAAAGLPLETLDVQAFENSLETVSERSLKAPDFAPVASENQPLLAAEPEGIASGKARDLLDKAARGNEGLSDRFSTLDDLLGIPGGKLTDITKPIYMPSDLLFDFNEDRLRDSAKTSLMMLGILIDRNPDTIFVIEGHTDTIGTEERNLSLSNRRASAVATWLQQSLRIPAERVRIEGFGESQPLVAPGGTVEDQQPNRRVEIRMLRPGKPATGTETAPAPPAAAAVSIPPAPAEPAAPPALAPCRPGRARHSRGRTRRTRRAPGPRHRTLTRPTTPRPPQSP